MKQYRNIDLIQLNTEPGRDDWNFPQNVLWGNEVIDKIVLALPTSTDCVSPVDGKTHVWAQSEVGDLYLDLYDSDENEICHNLHYSNVLFSNNGGLDFGHKLNLQLTHVFTTTPPSSDGCLLFYVFYRTKQTDNFERPRRNKCITFDLQANERLTFGEICRRWLHADGKNVRGLWFVDPVTAPAYLTLRDHDLTYFMEGVLNELMRGQKIGAAADNCQVQPFYMDSLDIDFEYSNILNATNSAQTHTIVIEY